VRPFLGSRPLLRDPYDVASCDHRVPQPEAVLARVEGITATRIAQLGCELVGLGDQVDLFEQHVGPWMTDTPVPFTVSARQGPQTSDNVKESAISTPPFRSDTRPTAPFGAVAAGCGRDTG
jgi:hypothetical protein